MSGLRDAQGGYGFGTKKKKASVGGPLLSGQALDPAVAGRMNGSGGGPLGSIDTPSFVPDYKNLIQNDPVFVQLQKDLAAQGAGDLAGRNAAINRLLVGFGGQLPDVGAAGRTLGFDLGSAIDPTTAALAQENQFSTQSRLGQAHQDALRQMRQSLAARGALQSGELGYQLDRENKAYGTAQYDANQQLLDALAQINSGFSQAERERQAQTNQGLASATDRQVALNPASGSQKAVLDPATGLYRDQNGNLWNPDRTPYTASAPPTVSSQPNDGMIHADPNFNAVAATLAAGASSLTKPTTAQLLRRMQYDGG